MGESLDRSKLLEELGYGDPLAAEAALEALVEAGLTNPRKAGIAVAKRSRVEETLARALARVCDRCRETPPQDGRRIVPVSDSGFCEVCRGSSNRLAVERAAVACRRHGVSRVVVVGGAPGVHRELRALWPADLELKIVSGTDRVTGREARNHMDWAHVVIIWGSTELDHKVSLLYTRAKDGRVFTVPRRGIQALADALSEHLAR